MDLQLTIAPGPRREQVERQLRDAVRAGRLRPGTRLPPTRTLAADLGVSRGVVVEAYEQLVAEGWLVARRGAGTVVAELGGAGPDGAPAARDHDHDDGLPVGSARPTTPAAAYDLRTGRPDLSAFPRTAWHAALGRALRTLPDEALGYGDPRGHLPLRAALAAYLGRARGVIAAPQDVVIAGGVHAGLHLVWPVLRERGARRVAVEDPGWRGQRRSVEHAGLELVPVRVDERGLRTDALAELDVDAVCVSPAHQYPTGVVLAPERRAALIAWAERSGGTIVEDDYDAEYRYDREAVGALQALAPSRVVYAGSASKTLAPALRLGWLAVPPHLTAGVAREAELAARAIPTLDQAAYADLLQRGEVDRHLRRTRRRYRPRRDALVRALGEHLPDRPVTGIAAGLHVVLELPPDADEAATVDAIAASGVLVEGLHENCTAVAPRAPALLLGYAALPEPALARAATLLAARIGSR